MKIDSKKLIFVHIPRTGGTTVEYICGIHGRVVGGGKPQNNVWWGGNTQHYTVSQMIKKLGKEKYKTYTSFSITRNPYDRLVSIWKRFHKIKRLNLNFEQFVDKYMKSGAGDIGTHLKHQYKYLTFEGKLCVDKLFKLENYSEVTDFLKEKGYTQDSVKQKDGRKFELYHENGDPRKFNGVLRDKESFMDYYNRSTLEKVNKHYAKDFELLGYDIIDPSTLKYV